MGVLVATGLLSRSAGVWGWSDRESLEFFADLIPLGVVVYATAVFVTEWVIRMVFWALAQREKDIEKRREEGRAQGVEVGIAQGRREEREEILQNLTAHGIEIPPEIVSALAGLGAVLLENGDVYAGGSLDVYVGRINEGGRTFLGRQGQPPELPGLWCQRGWRVRLARQYEEMLPAGRIEGLNLDASSAGWVVSLS